MKNTTLFTKWAGCGLQRLVMAVVMSLNLTVFACNGCLYSAGPRDEVGDRNRFRMGRRLPQEDDRDAVAVPADGWRERGDVPRRMAEGLIVQTERPNPRSEQALTRGVVVPGRAPVLFAVGQQLCGLRNGGVWMPCLHPNGVLGLSVKESVFNGTPRKGYIGGYSASSFAQTLVNTGLFKGVSNTPGST